MADEPIIPGDGAPPDTTPGNQLPDVRTLQAQLSGTKGRLKQVENTYLAEKEAWGLEKQTLSEQADAAKKALTDLAKTRDELLPFQQKATELEGQLGLARAQAAKQDLLMKYPRLLRDDLRALALSSTLEGDALEAHLKTLDETLAGAIPDPKRAGSTPPPPPASGKNERTAAQVQDEAMEAMHGGDFKKFNTLMSEHYQLLDKEKGKFVPAEKTPTGEFPKEPDK